jgi:hypothetical protein
MRIGSIKDGAATIAYGLLKYYTGNNTGDTPGNLPDPYYCRCSAADWSHSHHTIIPGTLGVAGLYLGLR